MLNIALSQTVDDARELDISGVKLMVKPIPNYMSMINWGVEVMREKAVHLDWNELEEGQRRIYTGIALARHVVEEFTPYTVTDKDTGETIEVRFELATDHPDFETMGEQMLALDTRTQEKVLTFAMMDINYRNNMEVKALGNSEVPSTSGVGTE